MAAPSVLLPTKVFWGLETCFRRFLFCATSLLPQNTPASGRSRAWIFPPGHPVVVPWPSSRHAE